MIVKGPGPAPQAIFADEADAANPAKPISVRRRVAEVTLLFEDMRRSPLRTPLLRIDGGFDSNKGTSEQTEIASMERYGFGGGRVLPVRSPIPL